MHSQPARDALSVDVLEAGDERPPWRASRGHIIGLGLALVLAAGAATAVQWRRHQAQERRLDRAAVASLLLIVVDPPPSPIVTDGEVPLRLLNEGPLPVRLRSAQLDFPGYRRVQLNATLAPFSDNPLLLRTTPTCGPKVVTMGEVDLLVDVVSVRGTARQLRLPVLAPVTGVRIRESAQQVCGMMPPGEALRVVGAADPRSTGREAVVDLTVANRSVLPLQLLSIDAGAGVSATLDRALPLALPPRPTPGAIDTGAHILLRVRTTSCPILLGRRRRPDRALGPLSLDVVRGNERRSVAYEVGPDVDTAIDSLAEACNRP